MKEKILQFVKKIKEQLKEITQDPKEMIIGVCLGELIFWTPVIICTIFAILISPWWWGGVSAIILFWAGPFTPAIPLQLGLIILIIKRRKIWKTKILKLLKRMKNWFMTQLQKFKN